MIGPEKLELKYREYERKLHEIFAANAGVWGILGATIGLGLLIANINLDAMKIDTHDMFNTSFFVIRYIRASIIPCIGLSLIGLMINSRHQVRFQFACGALLWLLNTLAFTNFFMTPLTFVATTALVPVICFMGWSFLQWAKSASSLSRGIIIYSAVFWLYVGAHAYYFHRDFSSDSNVLWRLKPQFIWISMITFALGKKLSDAEILVAVNPINAMRGILWPYDSRWGGEDRAQRLRLWWNGFFNILLGYILISGRIGVDQSWILARSSALVRFAGLHFLTICTDVGVFNIIVGLIRMYGYRIRDATNFALLSLTPADYWRRISVYNYLFVLQYVYMPLFRWVRNAFVATFFAFLIFFCNHFGFINLFRLLFDGMGIMWPFEAHQPIALIYRHFISFLLQFLLIYFSRRYWIFSIKMRATAKGAWASIVLNHIVMGARLYATLALYRYLHQLNVVP